MKLEEPEMALLVGHSPTEDQRQDCADDSCSDREQANDKCQNQPI